MPIMSLFGRLRLDIKSERMDVRLKEEQQIKAVMGRARHSV